MSLLQLPPLRIALRHPSVRAALALLVAGPAWVAWLGKDADAVVRLRALGFALVVAAALSWDDRAHSLTASTPIGLPAVRRGRAAVVAVLLAVAYLLGCLAVPGSLDAPVTAIALESVALGALLVALTAWFGRDGDSVLALPAPALLLSLAVLVKLPRPITFLHAVPGSPDWPDERLRWVGLLVLGGVAVAALGRDPASRLGYFWRAK